MIRDQLKGVARFDWRRAGLVCEIALPALSSVAACNGGQPPASIG
jgi:hypothetical protein